MSSTKGNTGMLRSICRIMAIVLVILVGTNTAHPQTPKESTATAKPAAEMPKRTGPFDEFDRGVPRSSVLGFFKAARMGDYERAAQYLDLRNLSKGMDPGQGPDLAHKLKIALDRSLWIDQDLLATNPEGQSEDDQPSYRDMVGRIKTPEKTVDILLQRVPRQDGVYIWKFSNRTVAEIPHLYEHFGYGPLEETLSKLFPDVQFLGWQLWQWALFFILAALSYLLVLLSTWVVALFLRRRETERSRQIALFVTGPVRILLWFLLIRQGVYFIGISTTLRALDRAETLLIIASTWAFIRLVDIVFDLLVDWLRKMDRESAIVLLGPLRNISKVVIVIFAVILWLDNTGFDVGAILAGLGVGGLAVALAAQDTLKNFLGSIMILLDRPYKVGQRIVVKGHDGVVEEIGLRSTRMRLLTGHMTTLPNEEMAKVDIENISSRPHIRRLTNISITFDTPPEKVEKAVQIIRNILDNHEGMDPEFQPRVYFSDFNPASLNILMLYWYHPPDYWGFIAFNGRVNLQIMQAFEKEGIKFAFPTTTTYLTQEDGEPLHITLGGEAQLAS
jgi:MscS family membrane protein